MARAIAFDLQHRQPQYPLIILDREPEAARNLVSFVGDAGLETVVGDAGDIDLVRRLMSEVDLTIGAASYHLNCQLTSLAVESGSHWVDLGGNNAVVARQFELDSDAKAAEVAIIPDCGLAPGIVNVLAGDARRKLDEIDELHFSVGGLPQEPKPPLFYGLLFSPDGLANEYSEPVRVIEGGRSVEIPPLTGREQVVVGPPYGVLEAFHTSGGSSTMVDTFAGDVQVLDYKTLRYPGHLRRVKLLLDLGLLDTEPIDLGDDLKVAPRRLLGKLLERLGWVDEDVAILKGWAEGRREEKKPVQQAGQATPINRMRVEWRMMDQFDPDTGLTAMARTTGFSAAIVARNFILSFSVS